MPRPLLLATIALLGLPTAAQADYFVPPSNSAATQYTEALPTAGGPRAPGRSKDRSHPSPGMVLGAKSARRLDARGPQGREVAEVVAATAPPAPGPGALPGATGAAGPGPVGPGAAGRQDAAHGSGAGGTASGNDTAGSGALGSVIEQATGAPASGGVGLLLPLFLGGVAAWAIVFLLGRGKRSRVGASAS